MGLQRLTVIKPTSLTTYPVTGPAVIADIESSSPWRDPSTDVTAVEVETEQIREVVMTESTLARSEVSDRSHQ